MRRTSFAVVLTAHIWLVLPGVGAARSEFGQTPRPAGPDVIYVPTPAAVVTPCLRRHRSTQATSYTTLDRVTGRIVIAAAKKYGARGVGIEIDAALVKRATDNAAAAGVSDRVRFVTQNLFTSDISEATVVTLPDILS